MTARVSAAAADATARMRVAVRHEQVLLLAAVRAGEEVARAREREAAAATAAAARVGQRALAHAVAVAALADAVGDERAGFVLGLTAKEVSAHRRAATADQAAATSRDQPARRRVYRCAATKIRPPRLVPAHPHEACRG